MESRTQGPTPAGTSRDKTCDDRVRGTRWPSGNWRVGPEGLACSAAGVFTAVETAQMLDTSEEDPRAHRLTASRSLEADSTVRHELLTNYIDAFKARDVDGSSFGSSAPSCLSASWVRESIVRPAVSATVRSPPGMAAVSESPSKMMASTCDAIRE